MSSNSTLSEIYNIQYDDALYAKNVGLIFGARIGSGTYSDVFNGEFNNKKAAIKVIHHNRCKNNKTYEQENCVSLILKVCIKMFRITRIYK